MKTETTRSVDLDASDDAGRFARGFAYALGICTVLWLIAAGAVSAIWLM